MKKIIYYGVDDITFGAGNLAAEQAREYARQTGKRVWYSYRPIFDFSKMNNGFYKGAAMLK